MKKNYLLFFCFFLHLLSNATLAQIYDAKVMRVRGVVVTRYARCKTPNHSDIWFIERESRLITNEQGELPFKPYQDGSLLRSNPDLLKKIGGNLLDYDDDLFLLDSIHKAQHDLRFCKFDSIAITDSGVVHINSDSGYYSDSSNIYSSYQFEGEVVIYVGIWPSQWTEIPDSFDRECGCPTINAPPQNVIQFAILKKIYSVERLSSLQEESLGLIPSDICLFRYTRCE